MRITDLATAMAPKLRQKIVGIRPGEKIHEIMCPADDSHLTLEFDDHFVITPTIVFTDDQYQFSPNKLDENGQGVKQGFEYNSGDNEYFLSVEEIIQFNHLAGFL